MGRCSGDVANLREVGGCVWKEPKQGGGVIGTGGNRG